MGSVLLAFAACGGYSRECRRVIQSSIRCIKADGSRIRVKQCFVPSGCLRSCERVTIFGFRNPPIHGRFTSCTPHPRHARFRRSRRSRVTSGTWTSPDAHHVESGKRVGSLR